MTEVFLSLEVYLDRFPNVRWKGLKSVDVNGRDLRSYSRHVVGGGELGLIEAILNTTETPYSN